MLFQKLKRELWQQKTQFFAIFLMAFLGLFVYVGMDAESSGAAESAEHYYEDYQLADFWIQGAAFSEDDKNTILAIPGVKNVQRCLIMDAKAEGIQGKGDEDAELTLYFIEENTVSRPLIKSGEPFDEGERGVWLNEDFAEAKHLCDGEELTIKADDFKLTLKVLGTIMSPEHVYYTSSQGEMVPDYTSFGYAVLPGDCYPRATVETGSYYNTLRVDTQETYKDNASAAMKNTFKEALGMDDLIITDRQENVSYSTFDAEIQQHKTMSLMFPVLFLIIAMLGIITTMTRMTAHQRMQIGTMKALGISNVQIVIHYVSFGFVVSLLGSILGAMAGIFVLPQLILSSMKQMYLLPEWTLHFSAKDFGGIVVVVLLATLVCFLTCRRELSGMPAQTLRPKAPKIVKPSWLEKTAAWRELGFSTQWNLRDIRKNKLRTLMGVIGIAGAMMLLICAFGCRDSMNYMPEQMFHELNLNQRTIIFEPGTDAFTVGEYARKYGGQQVETASIELVGNEGGADQKVKSATLTVVGEGSMLHFQDGEQNEISMDAQDVMLSTKMAELLGVQEGDLIRFRIAGEKEIYRMRVTKCNRTPTGQGVTMSRQKFHELGCDFEPNQVLTNYELPADLQDDIPVQTVQDIVVREQEMIESLAIMNMMIAIMIIAAVVLGLVVLYNLSELSFVEKVREYTTLKVLGMKEGIIKWMILMQNLLVGVLGVAAGIPLGKLFLYAMFKDMGDSQDMVAVVTLNSYLLSAIGSLCIAALAGFMMSGKVRKMDMVDALKSNE